MPDGQINPYASGWTQGQNLNPFQHYGYTSPTNVTVAKPYAKTGIANFLGGPIGGVLSMGANILGQVIQNRQQRKLQDRAFNQNVSMWKMQNEYNSPAQQMARYKEAGLNPNMIYGKGGSSGNASMLPKYSAPQYNMDIQTPDVLGKIQQYYLLRNQQQELSMNHQKVVQEKLKSEILTQTYQDEINKKRAEANRTGSVAQKEYYNMLSKKINYANEYEQWSVGAMRGTYQAKLKKLRAEAEIQQKEADWWIAKTIGNMISNVARIGVGYGKLGQTGKMAKAKRIQAQDVTKGGIPRYDPNYGMGPNLNF